MRFLFLLLFALFSAMGFAQDFGSGSLKIPPVGSGLAKPSATFATPLPTMPSMPSGILDKPSASPGSILAKDKNLNFGKTSTFINPGDRIKDRMNNADYTGEGKVREFKRNQYLGDVKTDAKSVRIVYRDYSAIDGDIVRVSMDNEILVRAAILGPSFNGVDIVLHKGANYIDFQALNEGDSPPNTAEFKIYDENNTLIYSSQWDIGTGYKASLIINKD